MKDLKQKFGRKLKEVRKANGLTQEKLAELIDLTPRQLTRIETGENFPSVESLAKLDEVLNIELMYLFDFSNRLKVLKTGTDDTEYISMTKNADEYEVSTSPSENKSKMKYPKRINASDSDTSVVLWAKNNNKKIQVEYPLAEDGEKVKIFYPDGRIEKLDDKGEKKKDNLSEEIIRTVNELSGNEAALEIIKTAIDSLSSQKATDKLKEIIKGMEAMRSL